eukprot:COSAG01_NODE_398_length_17547_cov_206.793501_13_plen_373_part_00
MFLDNFSEKEIQNLIVKSLATSEAKLLDCLNQPVFTKDDLPTLLSPIAAKHLEKLAFLSAQLTRQRFGHTMQLFVPLYLSNECYNHCTYCGFGIQHDYERKTLNDEEIIEQGLLLAKKGFQHLLLLTGEAQKTVGVDYIAHAIKLLKPHFAAIGVEIQPLSYEDYLILRDAGADHLTLYQETYHQQSYKTHHLSGFKKFYDKRLAAVEAGGKAGFHNINLGALMGLHDWRFDALSLAEHLNYMMKHYWQSHYALSFPRITKMFGSFAQLYPCTDHDLTQLISAFRLVFPDAGITLSTREKAKLRDGLLTLGVTTLSAESSTAPGGYSNTDAEGQFETHDQRSLNTVLEKLKEKGLDPMLKNWDLSLTKQKKY